MQLKFTKAADFRQERDFGAKIGATFEFLAAHWRPLGKCILYFVLPVALLLGIGLGLAVNSMFNTIATARTNPTVFRQATGLDMFGTSYFVGVALAIVGGLLSFSMLLSTVYAYVRLLLIEESPTPPAPTQVWGQIKARLGQMLLAFALLGGLYMVLVVVLVGFVAAVGNGTGVFLLFLVLLPLLVYVGVALSLYFPALWMEDAGVFAALRRCFYLVRSHWWASCGLLLVAGLIQSMMTFVFILPQYAVMIGKILKIPGLDSDALGLAAQCFYAVGIMFVYCVPLLAMLFQYFNLIERKEGIGLRSLVDSLGSGPAPVAYNHAYRPDDEGEY